MINESRLLTLLESHTILPLYLLAKASIKTQEKYRITFKEDAKPVLQQPRHIAYALRPKLQAVLER